MSIRSACFHCTTDNAYILLYPKKQSYHQGQESNTADFVWSVTVRRKVLSVGFNKLIIEKFLERCLYLSKVPLYYQLSFKVQT